MAEPPAGPEDSSGLFGRLSETPLFVVLRTIRRERHNGTLSVFREDQVRQLFFDNGELLAARSSREEHRIGETLVRWGYISEKDLQEALRIQKETKQRIDQVLVERGAVTRAVIDSEARRLMEQVVFSTLSWPDGTFHFQPGTEPIDLDVSISLSSEMIIEGIRRIPESERFMELLGDLSAIPALLKDPMSSISFRLMREAVNMLLRIDGKTDARTFLEAGLSSQSASAKIMYSLLFAGFIEMRPSKKKPARVTAEPPLAAGGPPKTAQRESGYHYDFSAPEAAKAPPPAPAPPEERTAPSHRELVLQTYHQLDWLSHYDLLGVPTRATPEEIEKAYRARSRLFDPGLKSHPDLVDCWRQLAVLSKWLRVAYEVLSNPVSRKAYDQKIEEIATFDRKL